MSKSTPALAFADYDQKKCITGAAKTASSAIGVVACNQNPDLQQWVHTLINSDVDGTIKLLDTDLCWEAKPAGNGAFTLALNNCKTADNEVQLFRVAEVGTIPDGASTSKTTPVFSIYSKFARLCANVNSGDQIELKECESTETNVSKTQVFVAKLGSSAAAAAKGEDKKDDKTPIVVGVTIAIVAIILCAILFVWYRRRKAAKKEAASNYTPYGGKYGKDAPANPYTPKEEPAKATGIAGWFGFGGNTNSNNNNTNANTNDAARSTTYNNNNKTASMYNPKTVSVAPPPTSSSSNDNAGSSGAGGWFSNIANYFNGGANNNNNNATTTTDNRMSRMSTASRGRINGRKSSMYASNLGMAEMGGNNGGMGIQSEALNPVRHEVVYDYEKRLEDEVTLTVGDIVVVYETFPDDWCRGVNVTTGESGIFPKVCLRRM